MILADKIMNLRKKAGWSQKELAEQLNVTRQSVSKWEGARAVPDGKGSTDEPYFWCKYGLSPER